MEKYLLNNVSTLWLGVGMALLAVGTTLLGLALVRRSVELRKLRSQHDVAGFIIAVVGVVYAALLAFMVVIQWEQYSGAETNASAEAAAVGNLYRDAVALGPQGAQLASSVSSYATEIADQEWPFMAAHQEEDPGTDHFLNGVWKAMRTLPMPTGIDAYFARQAVGDVSAATQDRRTRIEDSSSELPGPLWAVLLVGGALTVGFTYFFGLESFAAQATMLSSLAMIIALSLFVILTLDLPFTGDIAIGPTALRAEMTEFCSYNFANPLDGNNCGTTRAEASVSEGGRATPGSAGLVLRP